jgi:hypothetical protein
MDINFNADVSSKLRYFRTLGTLYTLSDRAHDGEPVRNGAHWHTAVSGTRTVHNIK